MAVAAAAAAVADRWRAKVSGGQWRPLTTQPFATAAPVQLWTVHGAAGAADTDATPLKARSARVRTTTNDMVAAVRWPDASRCVLNSCLARHSKAQLFTYTRPSLVLLHAGFPRRVRAAC